MHLQILRNPNLIKYSDINIIFRCKQFPADYICGYWESLACVYLLETEGTPPGFSLRLHLPTKTAARDRTATEIFQHRNSVLHHQFLSDPGFIGCGRASCDIIMKKYLKRIQYFSEKSLEKYEHYRDVHPEYSWNFTRKIISATFPQFYKDNSSATFPK